MIVGSDARTVLDIWTMLAASGHSVCATAREPTEVMRKASSSRPDLILVDFAGQADQDQIEAVTRLSDEGILAVALANDGSEVPQGTPVRAVIRKPVQGEYLSHVIAKVEETMGAT